MRRASTTGRLIRPCAGLLGTVALACALMVAFCAAASPQLPRAGVGRGGHLYLLAGTPTNESAEGYPVTLYTVGPARTLVPLREITGREEGLYEVREDVENRLLYVSYPFGSPTAVSVVHEDSPSDADEVEFNPKRLLTLDGSSGLASGGSGQSYALYLLVAAGEPSWRRRLSSSTYGAKFRARGRWILSRAS